MILRFIQKMVLFSRPAVLVFAIFLIGTPLLPLFGQRQMVTREDRDIGEINRRLNEIDQLQIDRRLTVLETLGQEAKDSGLWSKGSSVGTGLLLIEAVVRTRKKRKEEEEG